MRRAGALPTRAGSTALPSGPALDRARVSARVLIIKPMQPVTLHCGIVGARRDPNPNLSLHMQRPRAHGGDGVDREHDVADLDHGQHEQQRRGLARAVLDREEAVAVVLVADGDEAPARARRR